MKEKLDLRLFGITATEIYKRKINKHLGDIDPKLNKGNIFIIMILMDKKK